MGFWVRNKGNLEVSSLVNCIHINELDVRILNFSIRTPVDKLWSFYSEQSNGREVSRPHPAEVSRPHPAEVSRPHPVEVSRGQ